MPSKKSETFAELKKRASGAEKPQRLAGGGVAKSIQMPNPLSPMPLPGSRFGAMSLASTRPSALPEASPSTAAAKRGGRVKKSSKSK